MHWTCAAVLFDMDGTLVDSTAVVERAWGWWAGRHQLPLAEVLAFSHGRPTRDTMEHFLPGTDVGRRSGRNGKIRGETDGRHFSRGWREGRSARGAEGRMGRGDFGAAAACGEPPVNRRFSGAGRAGAGGRNRARETGSGRLSESREAAAGGAGHGVPFLKIHGRASKRRKRQACARSGCSRHFPPKYSGVNG